LGIAGRLPAVLGAGNWQDALLLDEPPQRHLRRGLGIPFPDLPRPSPLRPRRPSTPLGPGSRYDGKESGVDRDRWRFAGAERGSGPAHPEVRLPLTANRVETWSPQRRSCPQRARPGAAPKHRRCTSRPCRTGPPQRQACLEGPLFFPPSLVMACSFEVHNRIAVTRP
jgi:hypothetical protein